MSRGCVDGLDVGWDRVGHQAPVVDRHGHDLEAGVGEDPQGARPARRLHGDACTGAKGRVHDFDERGGGATGRDDAVGGQGIADSHPAVAQEVLGHRGTVVGFPHLPAVGAGHAVAGRPPGASPGGSVEHVEEREPRNERDRAGRGRGRGHRSSRRRLRAAGRGAGLGAVVHRGDREEGARALPGLQPALTVELLVGGGRDDPAHPEPFGQGAARGQPITLAEPPVQGSGPQPLGELAGQGSRRRTVQGDHDRGRVWPTQRRFGTR